MRNFKKILPVVVFLVICLAANSILTYLFYPYNYARIDVHNIETNAYDTLFLGSSHGKCGINPKVIEEITGEKSVNICMGGEYMQDAYFLVKNAARTQMPKKVVYELDPGYWVTKPSQGMDYGSFYQEFSWSPVKLQYFAEKMLKADFRSILFPWYVYRQQFKMAPANLHLKNDRVYKEYDPSPFTGVVQSYEEGGFIYRNVYDEPKDEENLVLWDQNELQDDAPKYFEKLKKFCDQNKIELIVITTPIPDVTYEKYQSQFDKANDYFNDYMDSLGVTYYNFIYMDMEDFDLSLDAFADCEGHMYGHTANEFSRILAGYLK